MSETQSLFNSYSNTFSITNINLKGYRGLTYLRYEYNRLYDYLNGVPGMAITVLADVAFLTDEDANDDPSNVFHEVKSRRYEITNTTQLMDVLNNMAADIQTQI